MSSYVTLDANVVVLHVIAGSVCKKGLLIPCLVPDSTSCDTAEASGVSAKEVESVVSSKLR